MIHSTGVIKDKRRECHSFPQILATPHLAEAMRSALPEMELELANVSNSILETRTLDVDPNVFSTMIALKTRPADRIAALVINMH